MKQLLIDIFIIDSVVFSAKVTCIKAMTMAKTIIKKMLQVTFIIMFKIYEATAKNVITIMNN